MKKLLAVVGIVGVCAWGVYVMHMDTHRQLGTVHELGFYQIDVAATPENVFTLVGKLQRLPEFFPGAEIVQGFEGEIVEPGQRGTGLLDIPGIGRVEAVSLLAVDYQPRDYLRFRERFLGITLFHAVGVVPDKKTGLSQIHWGVHSPNTQWWFHGCVMHLAKLLYWVRTPQALENAKKILESP